MSLDLSWDLYRTFYTVAKCNNFSKAAEKLFVTQPTISYSIKQLETNLNTKLFYRTPNGARLTQDGVELLNYVEKSYNILISGERNLIDCKNFEHGKISIGVQSHIGKFFLFPFIEKFHTKYPNIEINIVSRNTEEMIEFLENNNIDFMIDTSPIDTIYNNLKIEPLISLENCFISSKRESSKIFSLKELNTYNLILPVKRSTPRKQLDSICQQNETDLIPFMTIETTEMLIDAVKKDMGIGYVIRQAVEKDLEKENLFEIKIKEKLPTLELNVVYIDEYLTHIPRKFIKDIRKTYKNI